MMLAQHISTWRPFAWATFLTKAKCVRFYWITLPLLSYHGSYRSTTLAFQYLNVCHGCWLFVMCTLWLLSNHQNACQKSEQKCRLQTTKRSIKTQHTSQNKTVKTKTFNSMPRLSHPNSQTSLFCFIILLLSPLYQFQQQLFTYFILNRTHLSQVQPLHNVIQVFDQTGSERNEFEHPQPALPPCGKWLWKTWTSSPIFFLLLFLDNFKSFVFAVLLSSSTRDRHQTWFDWCAISVC